MRQQSGFLVVAALASVGITIAVSGGEAGADAGKSTVSAIVEGADTANNRGVVFVTGLGIKSFKTVALLDAQSADAGAVEVISQTATGLTIGLPAALPPGSYKLRLSPKKGDPCITSFTFRQTYALFGARNDSAAVAMTPIIGRNAAEGSIGVQGENLAATGFGFGVQGVTTSDGGAGVFGAAGGATGGWGGIFRATAPGGTGVSAEQSSPTGGGVALSADSSSVDGRGVQSITRGQGGIAWISFQDDAAGRIATYSTGGVERIRFDGNGTGTFHGGLTGDVVSGIGVTGTNATVGGVGVLGQSTNTTGFSAGVRGLCDSTTGAGVFGVGNGNGATGIWADIAPGKTGDPARFGFQGNTVARIDGTGKGFFNGGTQTGGADFAESVTVNAPPSALEPGDVLVIDETGERRFALSHVAETTLVAGIYSTKPGVLACPGDVAAADVKWTRADVPLAITGIVPCKVCDEGGPIRAGDLLVAASIPGHAKKAPANPRPGSILGKALGRLEGKKGKVEVLITMR